MARIRTIKPEILEDEKTAALSDAGFRLFVAMIALADDYGNVRADSRWLLGQVWWSHKGSPRVAEFLRELSDQSLIDIYEVRGGTYCHLRGWDKHQRIDNAGRAKVPMPNDVDSKPYLENSATRGEIPRTSEKFRSDLDQEREKEREILVSSGQILAEIAVAEINRLAGTSYRADSAETLKLCRALEKAGRTQEQVKNVIASKAKWVGDPKMGEYFRPATLLAFRKFESYLEALSAGAARGSQPRIRQIPVAKPHTSEPPVLLPVSDFDAEQEAS